MTEELKVSLGLREDGSIVHIDELDRASSRGLACRCVCAKCGDQLVARMGDVRQPHFAHSGVRDCIGGDESALHLFAKEVFQSETQFKVPKAEVRWSNLVETICLAVYIPYTKAQLEQGVGDIIPDITLMRDKKQPMLVEIRVTHEVDAVKSKKLATIGLPCIEIDLRKTYAGLSEGTFDRAGVRQLIIHGDGAEKTWVCIPNRSVYEDKLKEEERLRLEQVRLDYERNEELRRQAEELKRRNEEARARKRQERLDELLAPETIEASMKRKEAELAEHPMWKKNSGILGIKRDNIPYYLTVPIKGEYIFKCHRAIWQSTLFLTWVFNKAFAERSPTIIVEFAIKNLERHPELLDRELKWAFRDRQGVLSAADVVSSYFSHLEKYGFVRAVECSGNPYRWVFECLVPRVVALPPEYNNPRFLPRKDGILDTKTGELIDPIPPKDSNS